MFSKQWVKHYVKCPNAKFFLVRIFPYSVRILENTDQKKLLFGQFSQSDRCSDSNRHHSYVENLWIRLSCESKFKKSSNHKVQALLWQNSSISSQNNRIPWSVLSCWEISWLQGKRIHMKLEANRLPIVEFSSLYISKIDLVSVQQLCYSTAKYPLKFWQLSISSLLE